MRRWVNSSKSSERIFLLDLKEHDAYHLFMRSHIIGFAILCFLLIQPVQGDEREYIKQLPSFTKIEVNGRAAVIIEKSNENRMSVKVRSGSIDDLEIYVSGETLMLKKKGSVFQSRNVTVNISTSFPVSSLSVSGGALVKSYRNIFTSKIEIRSESGSSLDLFSEASVISLYSGRDSSIKIRGTADKLEARCEHGGIIDALLLEAITVYAYAYTGGIVKVKALQYLEAGAGLESSVHYKGEPPQIYLSDALGGKYIKE